MEAVRFDRLAKSLSTQGTRRGVLRLLALLPAAGGLLRLLGEVQAKKGKDCKPEKRSKTCKGRCGQVKNNCQKKVRCGTCATCEVCSRAHTCRPAAEGASCGTCRVCTEAGACEAVADGTACEGGKVCCSGACRECCVTDDCPVPACQGCSSGGVCESANQGQICGDSKHGGTDLRCCAGACPDPDCVTSGLTTVSCSGSGECFAVECCSENAAGCQIGDGKCICVSDRGAGDPCGSDADCSVNPGEATDCVCGTCQVPPP